MTREEFGQWIRDGLAGLRLPTATEPQRLSRWAWTADVVLAVFLAAATVNAAAKDPEQYVPGLSSYVPLPPRPPAPPAYPRHEVYPAAYRHLVADTSAPLWLLLLAALTALPLMLRRRYPVGAYWAVLVATLAFHVFTNRPGFGAGVNDTAVYTFFSCLIAAYSAAIYSPYRRLTAAALGTGAVLVAAFHDQNVPDITPGFVPFVMLVPIGLAANTIHTWRQRMRAMEAQQEAATRLAVDKERARIASELHDVVTHNVSMMTVQAGAARTVMATAPDQAKDALLAVEAAGRQAMGELRHVMGLLAMSTDGGDRVDLAPQPGLEQVADLADRVRGTGVPVELVVSGVPVALPAGVDLAAYRVAQEALTNTVKHAEGASVKITVDYRPGEVLVEVADTGGTRSSSAATGNGHGLIGLRERLAVYGGTLDAGRRISGGFRVRAVLPVGEA